MIALPSWNLTPSVATASDGSFVVARADSYEWFAFPLSFERFDRGGRSLGSVSLGSGFNPTIAMTPVGNFIVVWESERSLLGQRYAADGVPAGPRFQVNGSHAGLPGYPAIALANDGSFVVAWVAGRAGGESDVVARRFDASGAPIGDDIPVNTRAVGTWWSPRPDIAVASDQSFVVVWSANGLDGDQGGVFGRRFGPSGQPIGGEVQINRFTLSDQHSPSIAFDSTDGAIVAWQSEEQDGSGPGIYARRLFAAAGIGDSDGDGFVNVTDNCPSIPNPDQADTNADTLGDDCVAPDVVIHPTALIGFDPIIGRGSVLELGVVLGDHAKIGEQVRLERQVKLGHRVQLGDHVTVGIRATLGGEVIVGADTSIDGGASIRDGATIGDGTTIERNALVGPRATIGPLVVLEIGARIGRAATVEMGARVGRRAIVRPGAVVPPGTTVPAGTTFPP